MCRTRIKIIDGFIEYNGEIEDEVNLFISNPENKVAKVNSIEIKNCYDEDDDACLLAIINYELGD